MIYWFLFITIFTFGSFGVDKWLAVKHRRRVSEFFLLSISFWGGSLGGVVAMILFRHKVAKKSFVLKMALVVLVQLLIIGSYFVWGKK